MVLKFVKYPCLPKIQTKKTKLGKPYGNKKTNYLNI